MNRVGKFIETESSDLERIGYRSVRNGTGKMVSDVINEGDQAVIARDIIINGQVAFKANETVVVSRIQPSPQSPQHKYVVLSKNLNSEFALSDEDIRSAQAQVQVPPQPDVAFTPPIRARQQVAITRDIIVENQYAFRINEIVRVERVQPLQESPEHKYVVTSRTLNRQFTLSDTDVRGGVAQPPKQTSEVGAAIGSTIGSAVGTLRQAHSVNIDTTSGLARTLSLGILGCGIGQFLLFFFSWESDASVSGLTLLTKGEGYDKFLALFVIFIAIGSIAVFGYLNLKRAVIKKSFVFMALGGFGLQLLLLLIEIVRGVTIMELVGESGAGVSAAFVLIIITSIIAVGASFLLLRSIRT